MIQLLRLFILNRNIMTILTISSTNPDLSFILAKNPSTIRESKKPFERPLRKGRIYGWFTKPDNSEFRLMFKDSEIENSFGVNSEFEYLDISRYSNPYLPLMMINTALGSASKTLHEKDTGEFVTKIRTVLQVPGRLTNRFRVNEPSSVEFRPIPGKELYELEVVSDKVSSALGLVQIVCALASVMDENTYIPLPEEGIEKYLDVLNKIDAPYFLRHLFVSRAVTNRTLFQKLLGKINPENMKLNFGNTSIQRFDAIKQVLAQGNRGECLFDIGCGELNHTLKLAESYSFVMAVDESEDLFEKNSHRIQHKKVENVTVLKEHVDAEWINEKLVTFEKSDILFSEVLEHMPVKDALQIISAALETEANKIVITVPCRDFNKYFGLGEDEFRHPDHQWEPSRKQWEEIVEMIATKSHANKWEYKTLGVGDSVDSVNLSLMTVFSRKEEKQ